MDKAKASFIDNDFLLENQYAKILYHNFAASLPIIDYHNHLSPEAIANNKQFKNITQLWIEGDHYKWRAMRTLGINETYITGISSDQEKFLHYAKALPYTMRNPLYHWSHLELARYFNNYELLTEQNADKIYNETNALLQTNDFKTQALLQKMNVEVVCTTDDPTDDLIHHKKLAKSDFNTKVSTAFRPDRAVLIQHEDYNIYIEALEKSAATSIQTYSDLKESLVKRINYFHLNGCRLSDHGLSFIPYEEAPESNIEKIFIKRRNGRTLTAKEVLQFQTTLLLFLGRQYHKKNWTQQFHLGAMRNNNTRMYRKIGPDTGWDSIGNYPIALNLSRYLDRLDQKNQLAKTILYNLNPADNEIIATMIGNFNDGGQKGKIQWGSAWWFMDQLDGMTNQINTLSNMGLISSFIGMLTDSRSFLSFPRHEYFRRILCNIFGKDIENGRLPDDMPWIGKIISDICYYNAKNYFKY